MRRLNMVRPFLIGQMSEYIPDLRPILCHFFSLTSFDFLNNPSEHALIVGDYKGDDNRLACG